MAEKQSIDIKIQKDGLAKSVFDALRKAILEGKLKPGEWLRQENLATDLDVSQTTIREALNLLVGEGLAVRIPYRGVRVVMVSSSDLGDIYEMRAVLEGIAARSAAEHISDEKLGEMQAILQDTVVNEDPDSVARAREANRRFHEIFIRASNRRFLIRTLFQLWDWIDPLMLYSRTKTTEIGLETRLKWGERDHYQHERLLEALNARDGELALQAASEAVHEAWENLAQLIFNGETDVA
jgi:DNA-binding GntR family transcriptional regulator